MAEHLASIFGTEKDKVNCPFYFNIGACRHSDRCSRLHTKPSISPTLLLSNMYQRLDMITPGVDAQGQLIDPHNMQEHFEEWWTYVCIGPVNPHPNKNLGMQRTQHWTVMWCVGKE